MIIGIGSDLVHICRVESILGRFGSRFTQRIFTESECADSGSRGTRAAFYAKRFAAKEACLKALGTGLRGGISWRDVEVTRSDLGAPHIILKGKALQRLHSLLPSGCEAALHLTLTDDYPMAHALVLIEARKKEPFPPS